MKRDTESGMIRGIESGRERQPEREVVPKFDAARERESIERQRDYVARLAQVLESELKELELYLQGLEAIAINVRAEVTGLMGKVGLERSSFKQVMDHKAGKLEGVLRSKPDRDTIKFLKKYVGQASDKLLHLLEGQSPIIGANLPHVLAEGLKTKIKEEQGDLLQAKVGFYLNVLADPESLNGAGLELHELVEIFENADKTIYMIDYFNKVAASTLTLGGGIHVYDKSEEDSLDPHEASVIFLQVVSAKPAQTPQSNEESLAKIGAVVDKAKRKCKSGEEVVGVMFKRSVDDVINKFFLPYGGMLEAFASLELSSLNQVEKLHLVVSLTRTVRRVDLVDEARRIHEMADESSDAYKVATLIDTANSIKTGDGNFSSLIDLQNTLTQ